MVGLLPLLLNSCKIIIEILLWLRQAHDKEFLQRYLQLGKMLKRNLELLTIYKESSSSNSSKKVVQMFFHVNFIILIYIMYLKPY